MENAWEPIKRVLRRNETFCPESDFNSPFAAMVHNLRWLRAMLAEGDPQSIEVFAKLYRERHEVYSKLKRELSDELISATRSKEIVTRKRLVVIQREFLRDDPLVITTNWDRTLEDYYPEKIHYLHGNVDDPHSLYLPSEMIEDSYLPLAVREKHGRAAGKVMVELENIEQLVLYGISLSPLDTELGVVLREGLRQTRRDGQRQPLREAVIVDHSPDIVADRLQLYLSRNIKISKYHPDDLA